MYKILNKEGLSLKAKDKVSTTQNVSNEHRLSKDCMGWKSCCLYCKKQKTESPDLHDVLTYSSCTPSVVRKSFVLLLLQAHSE